MNLTDTAETINQQTAIRQQQLMQLWSVINSKTVFKTTVSHLELLNATSNLSSSAPNRTCSTSEVFFNRKISHMFTVLVVVAVLLFIIIYITLLSTSFTSDHQTYK